MSGSTDRSDEHDESGSRRRVPGWLNRTVLGIVTATFFSDFSHEMCTAVLPLYLATIDLGPASLGLIEGIADFCVSLSKLGGGVLGHHVSRKHPWVTAGYLVTTLATAAIGWVRNAAGLLTLRTVAWIGRGFRSPLRDYLLADAVDRQFYGRAYGLERAGDMLGAVAGPLTAAALIWWGVGYHQIILITAAPGLVAVLVFYSFVRERPVQAVPHEKRQAAPSARLPLRFWIFLIGVLLFGLGDFSRTFVIWLTAKAIQGSPQSSSLDANHVLSLAVLLYMFHNVVSAVAAYPAGHLGDRYRKLPVLVAGYALGVVTNIVLAMASGSVAALVVVIVLSGTYIAVEETIEKAAAAELLPRSLRSLGFGILASANAVGDMVSSITVGWLLETGRPEWAFGLAATMGGIGWVWTAAVALSKPQQLDEAPQAIT
jgi:MFS family permease